MEDEKLFTQADLDRVISERLAREKIKQDDLTEKYNALNKEYTELTTKTKDYETKLAELPKLQRDLLITKVAREKQLPDFIAGRLMGETEEELMKDADNILAQLGTQNKYQGINKTPSGKGEPAKTGYAILTDKMNIGKR